MKIIIFFLSENFPVLVVKFSIYLNRRVFVMRADAVLLACGTPTYLLDLIYLPTKHYQVISNKWELLPEKDFRIRGDKYIMGKVIILLDTTCLLALNYASTKHYQNILNHIHTNLA